MVKLFTMHLSSLQSTFLQYLSNINKRKTQNINICITLSFNLYLGPMMLDGEARLENFFSWWLLESHLL